MVCISGIVSEWVEDNYNFDDDHVSYDDETLNY